MKAVCICGGGSLGHVIAGYLGAKGIDVNILTRRPGEWSKELAITTPDGNILRSSPALITDDPGTAVENVGIILLCLPGYAIKGTLETIAPYVKEGTFVGSVFSSTGFFFEAMKIFGDNIPLWGFQRVPFIARTKEYGKSANLLGYKSSHSIAVENSNCKESFRSTIEEMFDRPVTLLKSHYEASFTNSNPILHPARLYSLFADWNKDIYYDRRFLFYEEWDNQASDNLVALDHELFMILDKLPVTPGYLAPILEYYESKDTDALTRKISSIKSFKGILAPMVNNGQGWQPDINSRYFQEDFHYGLRYIYETAHRLNIKVPVTDRIYNWGASLIREYTNPAQQGM